MRFRLITYNVHKCVGGVDRRYRPDRVHETIAHYQPDFALLQEVAEGKRSFRGHRQVDLLGSLLGMHHRTYFPNVAKLTGGQYGNAILSRLPLTTSRNIDLTVPPHKRRSVLHARYRIRPRLGRSARTLHVYNLHLGLSGYERRAQLRRLLTSRAFARLSAHDPVIIAGDFNDVWATLGRQLLYPAGFRSAGQPIRTFPAFAPWRPLDGVYVRGPIDIEQVFRSRLHVARRASDHLPLVADLVLH